MTVSKALKKLVAEGYVSRMEHKEDTRAKSVHLTKNGRALISKLVPIVEKNDEDFFGSIKKQELQSFLGILNNIVEHVDASDE